MRLILHKVKINIDNINKENTSIEIDGKPIRCKKIKFEAEVGKMPSVILELILSQVEIETEATVLEDSTCLNDEWRQYKAL